MRPETKTIKLQNKNRTFLPVRPPVVPLTAIMLNHVCFYTLQIFIAHLCIFFYEPFIPPSPHPVVSWNLQTIANNIDKKQSKPCACSLHLARSLSPSLSRCFCSPSRGSYAHPFVRLRSVFMVCPLSAHSEQFTYTPAPVTPSHNLPKEAPTRPRRWQDGPHACSCDKRHRNVCFSTSGCVCMWEGFFFFFVLFFCSSVSEVPGAWHRWPPQARITRTTTMIVLVDTRVSFGCLLASSAARRPMDDGPCCDAVVVVGSSFCS